MCSVLAVRPSGTRACLPPRPPARGLRAVGASAGVTECLLTCLRAVAQWRQCDAVRGALGSGRTPWGAPAGTRACLSAPAPASASPRCWRRVGGCLGVPLTCLRAVAQSGDSVMQRVRGVLGPVCPPWGAPAGTRACLPPRPPARRLYAVGASACAFVSLLTCLCVVAQRRPRSATHARHTRRSRPSVRARARQRVARRCRRVGRCEGVHTDLPACWRQCDATSAPCIRSWPHFVGRPRRYAHVPPAPLVRRPGAAVASLGEMVPTDLPACAVAQRRSRSATRGTLGLAALRPPVPARASAPGIASLRCYRWVCRTGHADGLSYHKRTHGQVVLLHAVTCTMTRILSAGYATQGTCNFLACRARRHREIAHLSQSHCLLQAL